jgi:hypothetical protein
VKKKEEKSDTDEEHINIVTDGQRIEDESLLYCRPVKRPANNVNTRTYEYIKSVIATDS